MNLNEPNQTGINGTLGSYLFLDESNYSVSVVGGVTARICIRLQPGTAVVDRINGFRIETLLDVSMTP